MHLTTKGRYAVKAMADLAIHSQHQPATLWSISERQRISLSYLEQLFSRLRRQNLVYSIRGHGGGYRLARPASDITIVEIIASVDDDLTEPFQSSFIASRPTDTDIRRHQDVLAHPSAVDKGDIWSGLQQRIYEYLSSVRLSQIIRQPESAVTEQKTSAWTDIPTILN